jgi:Raf kinase inhibitor-like YbhB/YbcL family protein
MILQQRQLIRALFLALFSLLGAAGCSSRQKESAPMSLDLTSPDFPSGGTIPKQFTCEGSDVSPALQWKAPPSGTQSFTLITDDPDAPVGTWVHWVLFDLPPTLRSLPQNFPKDPQASDGSRQGSNDFDKVGYNGPCPPAGKPHRYFFKLYALDTKLDLKGGATKKDVERSMQGHILSRGEYMGRYSR